MSGEVLPYAVIAAVALFAALIETAHSHAEITRLRAELAAERAECDEQAALVTAWRGVAEAALAAQHNADTSSNPQSMAEPSP